MTSSLHNDITSAALYIALLGLVYCVCTYITAQHSLCQGALCALLGIVCVVGIGLHARNDCATHATRYSRV